jgi:hypothetical protein
MSEFCVYFTFILGESDSFVAEGSSKDLIRMIFVIYFTAYFIAMGLGAEARAKVSLNTF